MRSSWASARGVAHDAGVAHRSASSESVPLQEALGRILAEPLTASIPIPHYASSAMDGWAIAGPGPWTLLADDLAAHARTTGLREGDAVEVLTGGLIPPGTFAVLQSEHGQVDSTTGRPLVRLTADAPADEPRPGRHIRDVGTESPTGTTLLDARTRLGPVHLAVAAGAGVDQVDVLLRPRVRLVLTGDEVVTTGIPGPGQVRDSFGTSLPGVVAALGGFVSSSVRVGDSAPATAAALGITTGPPEPVVEVRDITVTTGGTGASSADHVRALLREAGAVFLVDGVDVRPGGPALLARLPDGRLFVCLPGNPLAALLSVLTLLHPLLAGMQGQSLPPLRRVALASAIEPVRSSTVLRPYRALQDVESAGVTAEPTPWHGAAMLRGLAGSDGVLVCPGTGAGVGELVPSLDLPW